MRGSVEAEAAAEIERALQFARESEFPPVELVEQLVYADG